MKKVITFLLIFFIGIICVSATEYQCKYKISFTDKNNKTYTDTITFYLDSEKGVQEKFTIDSTGVTSTITSGDGGDGAGKIFNDKFLHFDSFTTIKNVFSDKNTCPSSNEIGKLTFKCNLDDNLSPSDYNRCYILETSRIPADKTTLNSGKFEKVDSGNDTGENGEKCYCCGSSSRGCTYIWTNKPGTECTLVNKSQDQCKGTTSDEEKNAYKTCGEPFVISPWGDDVASDYEGYSYSAQYFMENGKKWVKLTPIKGSATKEDESIIIELQSEAGGVTYVDNFANSGGRRLKIESFDKCEDVGRIQTCDVDEGTGGKILYVGKNCENDNNGDSDTKNDTETKDEYEKNYESKHPGATLKPPSKVGFGEGGDSCSEVLGPTLTAFVKEAVKWVRIAGAIIAIVNGMLKLIPAIMSKDAEALNKAFKTCIIMAIILVFCVLFDWLLGLIGSIFKWDVSCVI